MAVMTSSYFDLQSWCFLIGGDEVGVGLSQVLKSRRWETTGRAGADRPGAGAPRAGRISWGPDFDLFGDEGVAGLRSQRARALAAGRPGEFVEDLRGRRLNFDFTSRSSARDREEGPAPGAFLDVRSYHPA